MNAVRVRVAGRRLVAMLAMLLMTWGCQGEARSGPQPISQRLDRVSRQKPRGRVMRPSETPSTAPAASDTEASSPKAQAAPGPVLPDAGTVAADREAGFYQVVLVSGSTPAEGPPGLLNVGLQHGSARAVGELIGALYPPAGPGGTERRYTLVYPTRIESESAAALAETLDIEASSDAAEPVPADAGEAFRFGLGLIYSTPIGHEREIERLQVAAAALEQVFRAGDAAVDRRWTAGMIAAHLYRHRLLDYAKTESLLRAIQAAEGVDDLESLSARFAWARALVQIGQAKAARRELEAARAQFEGLRHTETFQRAAELRNELERDESR